MGERDTADMSKHTDEQLREGIERAEEQEPRVAVESSDEAHEAQQVQKQEMEQELERREGGDRRSGEERRDDEGIGA